MFLSQYVVGRSSVHEECRGVNCLDKGVQEVDVCALLGLAWVHESFKCMKSFLYG